MIRKTSEGVETVLESSREPEALPEDEVAPLPAATTHSEVEEPVIEETEFEEEDEGPPPLENAELDAVIEGLLFASSESLTLRRLRRMLPEADKKAVQESLEQLADSLENDQRGIELLEESGGYRLLTKSCHAPFIARLRGERKKIRLSKAAFESLAFIAYRQPVRRADLDAVRGVQSSTIVKNLTDWDLIRVVGRDDCIGKPLLYGTTDIFLEHFGIAGIAELPDPEDFFELGKARSLTESETNVADKIAEQGEELVEVDSATDEGVPFELSPELQGEDSEWQDEDSELRVDESDPRDEDSSE